MTELDYIHVRNLSQVKNAAALMEEVMAGADYGLSEERVNRVKMDLAELLEDAFEAVGPCETE